MYDQNGIREYWHKRALTVGYNAVGFSGSKTDKTQNENYRKREKFIFELCPTNMATLDYGCGVGRYAHRFPRYLGIDMTEPLLDLACARNPRKTFIHQHGCDPESTFTKHPDFELFFTATVLQHCPLDVVARIFYGLTLTHVRMISLYENCGTMKTNHVEGRPGSAYVEMIKQYLPVASYQSRVQRVHGEIHEHTLIKLGRRIK